MGRLGKGLRGAPRDALAAEIAPPARQGATFGLRQAPDTVGAVAGPLLAVALMWATSGAIRRVLWAATVPPALAVTVPAPALREPPRPPGRRAMRRPLSRSEPAQSPAHRE